MSSGIITFSSARELPQQVVKLEDEPDLPVTHLGERRRTEFAEDLPVETNRTRRRGVQGAEQVEQRALPGAAGADDRDELSAIHGKVHTGEDLDRGAVATAIDLAEPFRLENRAHSCRIASTGVSEAAEREG